MPYISREKNGFLSLKLLNVLNLGNARILEDVLFQDRFLLGYDVAWMRIWIPTFREKVWIRITVEVESCLRRMEFSAAPLLKQHLQVSSVSKHLRPVRAYICCSNYTCCN